MELNKFEDLKISNEIKKVVKELNYSELFPIQKESIPLIMKGVDVVGQAQTGTGKTAAFAIPILEKMDYSSKYVQAIILVPTRELAVQVSQDFSKLGKYKEAKIIAVYGGSDINKQIDILYKGVQIVVGTPGRVIDLIDRGKLNLRNVGIVVLDEADRMLDMGFIDDIKYIMDKTPKSRQTVLFSATMPEKIIFLAKGYMKNHETVAVSKDEITVKDIQQFYCSVNYYNKIDTLKKIIEDENVESAIIFCNTKIGVDKLTDFMKKMRYSVESIHGNISQARRNRVMAGFKNKKFRFLVATDVAARGLDIKGVSHVINYNVPKEPSNYVHRIGRTARAGKSGRAITFVTEREIEFLNNIKWYINMEISEIKYDVKPVGKDGKRSDKGDKRIHRIRREPKGPNKYALGNF